MLKTWNLIEIEVKKDTISKDYNKSQGPLIRGIVRAKFQYEGNGMTIREAYPFIYFADDDMVSLLGKDIKDISVEQIAQIKDKTLEVVRCLYSESPY